MVSKKIGDNKLIEIGGWLKNGTKKEYKELAKIRYWFDYVSESVSFQLSEGISYVNGSKQDKKRQENDYNLTIMLHDSLDKKIPNAHPQRAFAMVVGDLSKYFQKKGIPFCLPKSIGHNHEGDYSRIVYYDPKNIKKL